MNLRTIAASEEEYQELLRIRRLREERAERDLIRRAEITQAIQDEADDIVKMAAQVYSAAKNDDGSPDGDLALITTGELEHVLSAVREAKRLLDF